MSTGLPPPPQRADSGDFAWIAWQNQLYQLLSSTGSVSWATIDKSGSSLNDLQNKDHAYTTNQLGGGSYHLSAGQYSNVVNGILPVTSLGTDPTTSNLTSGTAGVFKNTGTGAVKLWVNDGGTMKSVALV